MEIKINQLVLVQKVDLKHPHNICSPGYFSDGLQAVPSNYRPPPPSTPRTTICSDIM